jgi:hypothetical protein
MVTKAHLFISLFVFLSFILSCKDEVVKPEEIKVSRRDYVWTVDTLSVIPNHPMQIAMRSLWGSDTTNIFAAGHSAGVYGAIFKYDGTKWKPLILPQTYAIPEIYKIYGFGKDDVFFVGISLHMEPVTDQFNLDSCLIYHYNGSTLDIMVEKGGRPLYTISGTKDELYTAGSGTTYFRYDGVNWHKEEFKFYIPQEAHVRLCASIYKRRNGEFWMNYNTALEQGYGWYYMYQLIKKGSEWVKRDSLKRPEENWKWTNQLWETPDGVLYSVGNTLCFFNGTSWHEILWGSNIIYCIDGTSSNNIFAGGNKVFHYNGKDWQEIAELTGKYGYARAIQCIQGQVFILFSDNAKSFVVRGRLK